VARPQVLRVWLSEQEDSVKKMTSTLRCKELLCLGLVLIFIGATLGLAAQKTAGAGIFVPDKGKLTILLEGKTVGHEEFEISPSGAGWLAKGTTEIKPAEGPATRITGSLALQADGAPVSYEWSSQAEKTNGAHIIFVNGVAKITLEMQGARPFQQELSFGAPLVTVLDNNLYHQYAVLARVYDWSKRGAQTFPVLIPQELTPGTITVEATGALTDDGKSYDGLRVTTSDLEVILYLDAKHRLLRLEVPSAKVSVIRE
jgi:hypothetical protein